MNTIRSFILICIIALFSCKKKETKPVGGNSTDTTAQVYDNYSGMKVGNYWVYREYIYKPVEDTLEPTGRYDSCYVEKDTVIGNKTYYKYSTVINRSGKYWECLRDSLSYIVDDKGVIKFSSEDFNKVFRTYTFGPNNATPDTLTVTEKMTTRNAAATTDAGTFLSYVFTRTYHYPKGRTPAKVPQNTYYVKNIGMVKEEIGFFISNPEMRYERQLVRYNVK